MKYWTGEDWFAMILVIGLLTFLGIMAVYTIADVVASQRCLKLGYPSARIDWNLNGYCIVRVDQTDVVVPLATAPRR